MSSLPLLKWRAVRRFIFFYTYLTHPYCVCLGKKNRLLLAQTSLQEARDAAASQRLQQAATADAFRGVHLDPNAHHWDEVRLS